MAFVLLTSLELHSRIFSPPWVITHWAHVRNTGKDREQTSTLRWLRPHPLSAGLDQHDRVCSVFIA